LQVEFKLTKAVLISFLQWLQLAEIHEQAQRWEFACFCYEEIILLKPAEPFPQAKLAECILRQIIDPTSNVHSSTDSTNGAAVQARKHAAHAVKQSSSTYPRALWTLAAACRVVEFVRIGRKDECLDPRVLDALDYGAAVNSDASVATTWAGCVGTSSATGSVNTDSELCKKDDNYALFVAAVQGLENLYKSASEAAAVYAKLEASQVPYTPSNWDGEVAGSWLDAAGVLQQMSDDIVAAVK
jgi:hypothetical protein